MRVATIFLSCVVLCLCGACRGGPLLQSTPTQTAAATDVAPALTGCGLE